MRSIQLSFRLPSLPGRPPSPEMTLHYSSNSVLDSLLAILGGSFGTLTPAVVQTTAPDDYQTQAVHTQPTPPDNYPPDNYPSDQEPSDHPRETQLPEYQASGTSSSPSHPPTNSTLSTPAEAQRQSATDSLSDAIFGHLPASCIPNAIVAVIEAYDPVLGRSRLFTRGDNDTPVWHHLGMIEAAAAVIDDAMEPDDTLDDERCTCDPHLPDHTEPNTHTEPTPSSYLDPDEEDS